MPSIFENSLKIAYSNSFEFQPGVNIDMAFKAIAISYGYSTLSELRYFSECKTAAEIDFKKIVYAGEILSISDRKAWISKVLSIFWGLGEDRVRKSIDYFDLLSAQPIGRLLNGEPLFKELDLSLLSCSYPKIYYYIFNEAIVSPPDSPIDFQCYLFKSLLTDWMHRYLSLDDGDENIKGYINTALKSLSFY